MVLAKHLKCAVSLHRQKKKGWFYKPHYRDEETNSDFPNTRQLITDSDKVQIKVYLIPEPTSLSKHRTPFLTLNFLPAPAHYNSFTVEICRFRNNITKSYYELGNVLNLCCINQKHLYILKVDVHVFKIFFSLILQFASGLGDHNNSFIALQEPKAGFRKSTLLAQCKYPLFPCV